MRESMAIALLVAIIVGLAILSPGHDAPKAPEVDVNDGSGAEDDVPLNASCTTATAASLSAVNLTETWRAVGEKVIFSSPNTADLNGDGTLDIIIGSGSETEQVGAVQAIDGATGEIIWRVDTSGEMVGTATLIDLNGDSTVDIVAGGRDQQLVGIDGATGTVLWRFDPADPAQDAWFQFYTGVDIGDIDGDGTADILQANGGDPLKAVEEEREAGSLVIVSGADGHAIISVEMPDGRETYMSPIVTSLTPGSPPIVLFGSGGETFSGSLWSVPLSDLVNGSLANASELITPTVTKGVIAPPSVVDLDDDGTLDIVAALFDGRLVAVSGSNHSIMWNLSIGGESYSSPAIGQFDDDPAPDAFIQFLTGAWPEYTGASSRAVSGPNGSILLARQSDSSAVSSPLAVDLDGNGRDEVVLVEGALGFPAGGLHAITILDACTGDEKTIWNGSGFPISTPVIIDLDSDGTLEMVWASSSFEDGWTVHRGELTAATPPTLSWGGYLGTSHTGASPL